MCLYSYELQREESKRLADEKDKAEKERQEEDKKRKDREVILRLVFPDFLSRIVTLYMSPFFFDSRSIMNR